MAVARFKESRQNRATDTCESRHALQLVPGCSTARSRRAPLGATLAEILVAFPALSRRTAQRRLSLLVESGHIAAVGNARARRYLLARPTASPTREAEPPFPAHISLSADGQNILDYVSRPLSARKPVGYQREFLESYRPNVSRYLSRPLCARLRRIGSSANVRQPAGTYSRAILDRLLIDLSWASSHLEGNTYSRLDTRTLIEKGRAATGKAAMETQMILNHKAAIELLVDNAASVGFDRFTLMNLHATLAENLLPNPADEGRVRQHVVEIHGSVFRPLGVPQQVDEALDVLLDKVSRISEPFEQSFFAMVHLPYLQPFADINKRTSRLAANIPC
ncbi:MAG: Fic family protein, partial [Betaproteobacteria bacterium]|nr:Fic family protein [Betaproteobacteria bacterium]